MTSQPLYHHSSILFSPGDQLHARLAQTITQCDRYTQFVEQVFEEIRQTHYPFRPSRLESLFLTPDADSLEFPEKSIVYEVSYSGDIFLTDQYTYNDALYFRQYRPDVEEIARRYWQAPNELRCELRCPEMLVKGEATIIGEHHRKLLPKSNGCDLST